MMKIVFLHVLLIFIFLASGCTFFETAESDVHVYNSHYFARLDNGLWSVALDNYADASGRPFVLVLHNLPEDVENIDVSGNMDNFFPSNETYLSYNPATSDKDPELMVALMDLSIKLAGSSAILQNGTLFNPLIACSEEGDDVCNEIGVVNCKDSHKNIILFEEADKTSISFEGKCITISSEDGDFIKAKDRLVYSLFGIISP